MTSWSRRELLLAGLAGATTGSLPALGANPAPESLAALGRKKGLWFGTALSGRGLRDPAYLELIANECAILVHENELKMTVIQRNAGEFNVEPAQKILAFADEHHLLARGHTLLWHHPRWLPKWMETHDFGTTPATTAASLLETHIRRVTTHFGKRLCSWDVVNEAVHNVTGEMRETVLSKNIGSPDQVVELAFRIAREQLPDTELVYNDYMGWELDSAPHRTGVLKLLERLRRNGVPVDSLGIQSHIGCGNQDANVSRVFDARDERSWRQFLTEVTGMGYRLAITEFDVHDATLPEDITKRDAAVASLGRAFLDITLDFREVSSVLCWGLADNYTWLQGRNPRQEGVLKRPTPFDSNYRAKPLREAIAAAFRAAPLRPLTIPQGKTA